MHQGLLRVKFTSRKITLDNSPFTGRRNRASECGVPGVVGGAVRGVGLSILDNLQLTERQTNCISVCRALPYPHLRMVANFLTLRRRRPHPEARPGHSE